MICPRCGSENVSVQAVTETKSKTRWGCGCLFTWLAFLFPKYKSKTHTEAICQNCGNRWKVSKSDVRNASQQGYSQDQQGLSSGGSGFVGKLHSPELPFYKRRWFLITSGILLPPVGIALVWLVYKDWTLKKKAIVTGIMALWFIIALLVDGGKSETPVASNTDTKIVSSVEIPSASDQGTTDETAPEVATEETTTTTTAGATKGELMCKSTAEDYLSFMPFSRKSLGEQLRFEGFTQSEIDYALSQMDLAVSWDEQAYLCAVQYLDTMDFSRAGLIDQLEFDGYTHDQAVYGADKAYNE